MEQVGAYGAGGRVDILMRSSLGSQRGMGGTKMASEYREKRRIGVGHGDGVDDYGPRRNAEAGHRFWGIV